MSANLLRRKRGAAIIQRNGINFFTKDAIAIDTEVNPFEVGSDAFGVIDSRYQGRVLKVGFTPIGAWNEDALNVLFPFRNYRFGQFNTPVLTFGTVTAAADTVGITGHGLLTGTGVRVGAVGAGVVPAGLSAGTLYYISVTDANTIKFHLTQAAAIAGTSAVDITDAGTAPIRLVVNNPMVIHWLDGTRLTVHNAACTKMPGIECSPVKTLFTRTEYEGYAKHGSVWSDANSLYTLDEAAVPSVDLDPDDVLTSAYTAKFGADALFEDLQPREGTMIDFEIGLGDVPDDNEGILCRSITSVSATAKLRPLNLLESDILGKILLQGSGAGRGKSLPTENLDVFAAGDNPFIRLYGAQLLNAPLTGGAEEDRIGELEFKTKRTFSAGAANPVFYVGTEAPA